MMMCISLLNNSSVWGYSMRWSQRLGWGYGSMAEHLGTCRRGRSILDCLSNSSTHNQICVSIWVSLVQAKPSKLSTVSRPSSVHGQFHQFAMRCNDMSRILVKNFWCNRCRKFSKHLITWEYWIPITTIRPNQNLVLADQYTNMANTPSAMCWHWWSPFR